jgi:LacI family transcriptional regulator, gluconate utilization system Gnt-I transcriptional repressor
LQSEKRQKKPTLSQVAQLAGVSEITASRAMRDSASVASNTVQKVQDAASQLGYLRNRLAGALAGGPSNQVGVILPSLANIVFADVLKGLEDHLEEAGFHPVLGISNYDPQREERLIRDLLSWRPAGLVIAPSDMTLSSRELLRDAGLPVVEIMDVDTDPIDMCVGMSHHGAGSAMARYLIASGYKRFAYIGHDIARDQRAIARLTGFRETLEQMGHDLADILTMDAPSSVALGRDAMARLLRRAGDRPDIVYFSNDDMAVGGVFHCMSEGIGLPDDIAIAGFNGLDIGQALPVPLTTTGSHRARIGQRAADAILQRLKSGADAPQPGPRVDVGFTLIKGGTA